MKVPILSRTRLIAFLTIILIFTFTFTSLLSYNVTKESLTRNTKTEILPLISDNIYSEIQQILITPINNSSLMANDEFLINWVIEGEENLDEIERYLKRIKEKYGYFSSFFVSDITNNYYYYDGILKQISPNDKHDIWYYKFVDLNSEYDLDVDTDEATQGTITIFINHRLEDHNGNFLGVTGIGLEMDAVGKTLEDYQKRYNHLIYMIDSNGLVQIHPQNEYIEKINIKDLEGIGELSEKILSQKSGTNIYEYKNEQGNIVISARYFPSFDWYLIVEQDQAESLITARSYLIGNILIGIVVTLLVILIVIWTLNQYYLKLETLAINDDLTGLYKRHKFEELFQQEISYARRYEQPLSLLMIDIDHFKSINDNYGHPAGDQFLKIISSILQKNVREIDPIGRWGGEEFVILLHRTDEMQAFMTAERLRKSIFAIEYDTGKGPVSKSVSIGVASALSGRLSMEEMIHQADEAMYRAKQEGRNRTCTANQIEDSLREFE